MELVELFNAMAGFVAMVVMLVVVVGVFRR